MITKLTESDKIKFIRRMFAEAADKRIDVYSASTAFYIFISFIPFALVLLSTVKYLPFSKQELISFIDDFLPLDINEMIVEMINELYERGIGVLSVSAVAVIWASAKGLFGITKGLNDILDIRTGSNIYLRARSAVCTLILMTGMVLMLVIAVFGNTITGIINRHVMIPRSIVSLLALKNVIMFCMLFLLFLFLFCVLPARKVSITAQIPGAAAAGFLWILFTKLFSFYLSTFNGYSMYGSFAVILVIGVWLYAGMYIMFMGALANKMLSLRKGLKNEGSDQ